MDIHVIKLCDIGEGAAEGEFVGRFAVPGS